MSGFCSAPIKRPLDCLGIPQGRNMCCAISHLTRCPQSTAPASNSGVYMLPDLTLDYPLGMGGLDLDENQLRRYLGRRLIILLGDADTDASAPDLPRDDFAM